MAGRVATSQWQVGAQRCRCPCRARDAWAACRRSYTTSRHVFSECPYITPSHRRRRRLRLWLKYFSKLSCFRLTLFSVTFPNYLTVFRWVSSRLLVLLHGSGILLRFLFRSILTFPGNNISTLRQTLNNMFCVSCFYLLPTSAYLIKSQQILQGGNLG